MNNFTNSPINLNRLHAHTHNDSLSRDKGKTRNKGKAYNSSDWLRSTDVYTIVHNATHTHTHVQIKFIHRKRKFYSIESTNPSSSIGSQTNASSSSSKFS